MLLLLRALDQQVIIMKIYLGGGGRVREKTRTRERGGYVQRLFDREPLLGKMEPLGCWMARSAHR